MFEGDAEKAMNLYTAVFRRSEVARIERYGPGEPGVEGSVKRADFTIGGHRLICIDSYVKHGFSFTPSVSIFVECEDDAELDRAFGELSAGGQVLMPLDNYGFSTRFGWINDRFGVSWQLNLE
jgi:predicted 3-demethylubiquinone-9 3-methyltransferase (glyoxalase superfamily)